MKKTYDLGINGLEIRDKHVIAISLRDQELTTIPDSIGELINLKRLLLQNNQISILPKSLVKLKKLTILDLDGNPIDRKIAISIVSQLPSLEYLWYRQSKSFGRTNLVFEELLQSKSPVLILQGAEDIITQLRKNNPTKFQFIQEQLAKDIGHPLLYSSTLLIFLEETRKEFLIYLQRVLQTKDYSIFLWEVAKFFFCVQPLVDFPDEQDKFFFDLLIGIEGSYAEERLMVFLTELGDLKFESWEKNNLIEFFCILISNFGKFSNRLDRHIEQFTKSLTDLDLPIRSWKIIQQDHSYELTFTLFDPETNFPQKKFLQQIIKNCPICKSDESKWETWDPSTAIKCDVCNSWVCCGCFIFETDTQEEFICYNCYYKGKEENYRTVREIYATVDRYEYGDWGRDWEEYTHPRCIGDSCGGTTTHCWRLERNSYCCQCGIADRDFSDWACPSCKAQVFRFCANCGRYCNEVSGTKDCCICQGSSEACQSCVQYTCPTCHTFACEMMDGKHKCCICAGLTYACESCREREIANL